MRTDCFARENRSDFGGEKRRERIKGEGRRGQEEEQEKRRRKDEVVDHGAAAKTTRRGRRRRRRRRRQRPRWAVSPATSTGKERRWPAAQAACSNTYATRAA